MQRNSRAFRRAMAAWEKNRRGKRKPAPSKRQVSKYKLTNNKKARRV